MNVKKQQIVETAIALRKQGVSCRDIAMQLDVHNTTVAGWMRKYKVVPDDGGSRERHQMSERMVARILELRRSGLNLRQIADELSINFKTVITWLKKHGYTRVRNVQPEANRPNERPSRLAVVDRYLSSVGAGDSAKLAAECVAGFWGK